MSYYVISAGALRRRSVRAYLEQQKFMGRQIEWLETKGLIDSVFTIRGSEQDMAVVAAHIENCEGFVRE